MIREADMDLVFGLFGWRFCFVCLFSSPPALPPSPAEGSLVFGMRCCSSFGSPSSCGWSIASYCNPPAHLAARP